MGTDKKLKRLRRILAGLDSAVVAFSGGVDSTLLARVAGEALGGKVLAVTVESPFLSREEKAWAARVARKIKIPHRRCRLKLSPKVMANGADRCYRCKKEIFSRLRGMARKKGYRAVIEGSNKDDLKDYRPGERALAELRIRSPLREAGLTKRDIRALSRRMGLETWDRPSSPCLATRVPYGERITPQKLEAIAAAEAFLKGLGIVPVRFRRHGDIGRIETTEEKIPLLWRQRRRISQRLKRSGVRYVCLDMEGYRTGSMNEAITWTKKR